MNRTKIIMSSLIMPRRRRCNIIVVLLLTVLFNVITSSVFTTAANTVTANGNATTRRNSNKKKKKKKKKECYEHDSCKSCLNSKDQSDCVWEVAQERSRKYFGGCTNKKECVPVPPAIDRNIVTYCQEGTKRKKKLKTLKPSQWKKRNKKRCSKLKKELRNSVQDQENSESCYERSDSCDKCTSTKLNILTKDGELKVDAETCQWFASGYCGYQCNWWDGCGETTCSSDYNDDDLIQLPDPPYEDDDDEFEDDDDEEFLDEYNSDLCRSQTKCDDCVQTSLKLPTGVSTLVAPTCNWIPPSFEDFDDEEVEMEIETGRCVGNGYCSHRCEKGMYNYNCGVTGLGTDVCLLPKEGTEFLKYIGSEEYTGNEVKIMLLDSFPGLDVQILEEGKDYTEDYRIDRVRVFVEASDDDDDYDDTCNRKVVSAPKVG